EATGGFERGATQQRARVRDRVALEEEPTELLRPALAWLELLPALAGGSAVLAHHQRAPEAGRGIGVPPQRVQLRRELAGLPGVVGVAESDQFRAEGGEAGLARA